MSSKAGVQASPPNDFMRQRRCNMTLARAVGGAAAGLFVLSSAAAAQAWRRQAAHLGTTARILLVGTRPEDEDNALIAWLSLERHIETAYLSLTRGESGANLIGSEHQAPLAVVRTAELLEERKRDGARQYFTRAYDFGPTDADSTVDTAWPHDVLLADVVSIVRAFRPNVIIALTHSDDRGATRRVTARLTAEAFAVADDSARLPRRVTSHLPAWPVGRLFTRVEQQSVAPAVGMSIDVGEFDRQRGHSYAELGAEIRQLQRTQGPPTAPALGPQVRWLRLDSTRTGREPTLFGAGLDRNLNADAAGRSHQPASSFLALLATPPSPQELAMPHSTNHSPCRCRSKRGRSTLPISVCSRSGS